jgi:aspartate/methionine/tyrosine aminotransferase
MSEATPGTTIFEFMSALARETGAINLGQGFPDREHAPELLTAAQRALVEHSNQYPPMRGLAELRRAVANYYAREQGLAVAPEEIIVTSGATEAIAASIFAFLQPGEEAILFQPAYDAYRPLVERAGGRVKLVNLVPPDWSIPLDAFEAAIGPKTRLVMLNTPNNPTGTMLGRETLDRIGALCERHDLILVCDEVWEGMVFGEARHVSPLACANARLRSVRRARSSR